MNDDTVLGCLVSISTLTPLLLPGLALLPFAIRGRKRLRASVSRLEWGIRWSLAALTGTLLISGGIGFAAGVLKVFAAAGAKARSAVCLQNIKDLSIAVVMYVQDWDDTLPPASRWDDGAIPRLQPGKADQTFRCPSASSSYGYAYNRALDSTSVDRIDSPPDVVMLFESDAPSRNTVGDRASLPPTPRHSGGSIFGFADGHAIWANRYGEARLRWNVGSQQ